MSFVKMPQEDYVTMCNKLRAMLNETQDYTSKDFIEKMDELIYPNLDDIYFGESTSLLPKGKTNPQYYENIAQAINELKDDNFVVLEELDITENKKYEAPAGKAYSVINANVEGSSGGGATVEVVQGTIAHPFGEYTISQLNSLRSQGLGDFFLELDGGYFYVSYLTQEYVILVKAEEVDAQQLWLEAISYTSTNGLDFFYEMDSDTNSVLTVTDIKEDRENDITNLVVITYPSAINHPEK